LTAPYLTASMTLGRIVAPTSGRATALIGGLIAVSVAAAGCGSSDRELLRKRELPEPREASLEEVLAAYDLYCDGIETFKAAGEMELRNTRTGRAHRFRFDLLASREGVRLEQRDADTGFVLVSDDGAFALQSRADGRTWRGAADEPLPSLSDIPLEALRPSDLATAFVPAALTAQSDEALFMEGERSRFALTLTRRRSGHGVAHRQVFLERASLRLQRVLSFDADGNLRSEVSWHRWRDGVPREILVTRPLDGTLARLELDRAAPNAPVAPGSFSLDGSTQ
jgi:hypothetical protein